MCSSSPVSCSARPTLPSPGMSERRVTFIDSTGIRVLWQAHQRSEQDGTRLSLIPGDGSVGRALQLTGLIDHMDLLDR